MLDDFYRPVVSDPETGKPDFGEAMPPPHPSRVRAVIYAFAEVAHEEAVKLAGGKVPQERGQPRRTPE
jgi:hypothetical protein